MSEALKDGELRLSTKPSAALHYSYMPGSDATDILVVFINGLMLPRVGWTPTINLIAEKSTTTRPAMLSYDRYGQGTSDADPADSMSPRGVHDLMDVVRDLDTFLSELGRLKMPDRCSWGQPGQYRLVFVCNSIGCPIARLFAQERPGSSTVSAFVFLDSMMANTDFVSMFPDPDATDFKPDTLPQDLTVQDIRRARQVYKKFFHPSVPNQEHLDRSNAAQLLPYSDQPKLCGSDDRGPWLTVVGHDWDIFAAENKVNAHEPWP